MAVKVVNSSRVLLSKLGTTRQKSALKTATSHMREALESVKMKLLLQHIAILTLVFAYLISSCASQKTVNTAGNDFPIIHAEPVYMGVSSYGCESIVKDSDTITISTLLFSDSTQFGLHFLQQKNNYNLCMEQYIEGTTFYSVKINQQGGFENLQIIREVNACFKNVTAQIESVLNHQSVLEQEYFNTQLIFYHTFRIRRIEP